MLRELAALLQDDIPHQSAIAVQATIKQYQRRLTAATLVHGVILTFSEAVQVTGLYEPPRSFLFLKLSNIAVRSNNLP